MREEIEKILSEFFTFAHYQDNGEGTKEEAQEKLQQATDAILAIKIDEEKIEELLYLTFLSSEKNIGAVRIKNLASAIAKELRK